MRVSVCGFLKSFYFLGISGLSYFIGDTIAIFFISDHSIYLLSLHGIHCFQYNSNIVFQYMQPPSNHGVYVRMLEKN